MNSVCIRLLRRISLCEFMNLPPLPVGVLSPSTRQPFQVGLADICMNMSRIYGYSADASGLDDTQDLFCISLLDAVIVPS